MNSFSFGTTNSQQQGTSSFGFGFGQTSNQPTNGSFGFGTINEQPVSSGFSRFGQPVKVVQMEQTGNSSSQSTEDCFDKKSGFDCFGYSGQPKEVDQEMVKEYFGMLMKGELNDIRVWMDNTNVMNPTFCINMKNNSIVINGNSVEIHPVMIRKEKREGKEFLTIVFEGGKNNVVKFHLERRKPKINVEQLGGCNGNPNNEIMRYVYANINGYVIANGKALVIDVR